MIHIDFILPAKMVLVFFPCYRNISCVVLGRAPGGESQEETWKIFSEGRSGMQDDFWGDISTLGMRKCNKHADFHMSWKGLS